MLSLNTVYKHPKDGNILVVGGQYMGGYGSVSNFWYWHRIKKDGSLGVKRSGYGGNWEKVDAEIITKVRIV